MANLHILRKLWIFTKVRYRILFCYFAIFVWSTNTFCVMLQIFAFNFLRNIQFLSETSRYSCKDKEILYLPYFFKTERLAKGLGWHINIFLHTKYSWNCQCLRMYLESMIKLWISSEIWRVVWTVLMTSFPCHCDMHLHPTRVSIFIYVTFGSISF